MASNNKQPVSAQKASICERSVLKMSDDEIKKRISLTHSRTDQKFDVGNLFAVVRNILHPAFTTVENIVYGTKQPYVGNPGESGLEVSFIPPLCLLKQLSSEMACKNPGEKTAYDTTMSILNKLKDYSWDAKAVLTLAAFALDYGEFWHFAQFYSSDQLTKSVGILKRVPIVLIPQSIDKYRKPIIALNILIKETLDVIECIFKLEQRFTKLDLNDEPTLSTAKDCISVDVFWAIITIVDCMARMCCLVTDWDRAQELLPFSGKITTIHRSLTDKIERCKQIEAEREAYLNLKRFLQSPHDIVEVFKKLIFAEDSTYSKDGQKDTIFTNELVISRIEELKTKNVLLLFSDLDISEEDVSILKPIHKEITKTGRYKIVWVPIVEQWMHSKYKMLQSKMEWYIVPHFSSVSGIKYIKEEWKFKNKPIIVVLNEEGTVKHRDAFHMIKTWGIEAFPFDDKREKELCKREDWFGLFMINFSPNISTWINEGKYIFFYGGEDEWIAQFHQEATRVKKDLAMGGRRIFIELFGVANDGKGKDDLGIFWKKIQNFYPYNSQKVTELETKTKEIQKLLSYRNDKGWVVLCKGARLVFSGYGTTVLTIFQKFDEWKLLIQQGSVFEECLLTQYNNDKGKPPCREFQVPTSAGHLTHSENCADCSEIMEMYIRFRCCHKHHSTKAAH